MAYHDMQKRLDLNRGEAEVRLDRENRRAFQQGIAKLTTFRPGQTSLGAAREDERKRMGEFFAQVEALRSISRDVQKHTELSGYGERIGDFLNGLDDALSDAGIIPVVWADEIERLT